MPETLLDLARTVLAADAAGPLDAGPAVLAGLFVRAGGDTGPARDAVGRWLDGYSGVSGAGVSGAGVHGGLAGLLAGLSAAAPVEPGLDRLADRVRAALSAPPAVRRTDLAWSDYDLISGPAGVLLALHPAPAAAAADHLAALCASGPALRLGDDRGDPRLHWNLGHVNTGVAHGAAGVAAALARAGRTGPLRAVCDWLVARSFRDPDGLLSWPPADGLGRPVRAGSRQAWCYGTPGVSFVLWDAGTVLADPALRDFAAAAMTSFCAAYDPLRHLDPGPAGLGICHGMAGTLLIADAFARHAGLAPAAALAGRIAADLSARLDELLPLARTDRSLLTGASGVLAALLTRAGDDRGWLTPLALR